jgi:hypothetical protein
MDLFVKFFTQLIRSLVRPLARSLVRLYAIAAIILPALVPMGYMVSKGTGSNIIEITICSAFNHRQVLMDLDTGQLLDPSESYLQSGPQSGPQASEIVDVDHEFPEESLPGQPCPFASSSGALLLVVNELFIAPAVTNNLYFLPLPTGPPVKRLLAPLPARGPPTVSRV